MESQNSIHIIPRVIMLGTTGTGKSSLCNTLAGDPSANLFKEGDGFLAGTVEFHTENVTLQNGMLVKLIDVPGTGDGSGNDSQYYYMNALKLKEQGFINAFFIVLNSKSPRFDMQT